MAYSYKKKTKLFICKNIVKYADETCLECHLGSGNGKTYKKM